MTRYELDVLERAHNISQHIWTLYSRLEIERSSKALGLNRPHDEIIKQLEYNIIRMKCIYFVLMGTLLTKPQLTVSNGI